MTTRIDPTSVGGIRPRSEQDGARTSDGTHADAKVDFKSLLDEAKVQHVQFSKHAAKRLETRNIELNKDDLALLSDGINRAEKKGSKESLLLMNDTAFVVNVKDRTIITAVDEQGMKEKTFTNIDSAIMLSRTKGKE